MPLHPTLAPIRRPRRGLAALALTAIACAGAGCGSSHSTGSAADPAAAVPASASLYAGATVRPGGSLKTSAAAAGRALTHQADPYLRLLGALQTPGSPALSFKRDLASWLGVHAGVFLSSKGGSGEAGISRLLALLQQGLLGRSSTAGAFPFTGTGVQGAIVLDTSDAAKARSFMQSQARSAGAHTSAYRGVSYQATGGIAFGVVDRLAVIGSESGMHGVIDTTLGGPSLANATGYSKLLASAPAGALAHLYANAGALRMSAGETQAKGLAGAVSLLAGGSLVNVSLVPSTSSIALDADTIMAASSRSSGGLLSSSSEATLAAGELPGESWLAVGLGDVGRTLGADVQALEGIASLGGSLAGSGAEGQASGGLSVKGLLDGILAPLRALGANSAQNRRDFASWMGSAGLFAAGSGLLELKGGVVIDSKNAALSRAAVSKLAAKLRQGGGSVQSVSIPGTDAAVAARLTGLPVVLDIADGRDASGQSKFVIGIGEASVAAALKPSSTLSGAASYSAAASALGEHIQPSVTADFPMLLSLLEGAGLSEDPTIAPFVPYLRSLTTLAGGGKSLGGGIERFRLVLGLQPSG
jgi:hypothetical protein